VRFDRLGRPGLFHDGRRTTIPACLRGAKHGAAKDDQPNKRTMSRISQAKKPAENCERGETLKAWRGKYRRPVLDRRDRDTNDEDEQGPRGDRYQFMKHVSVIADRTASR